MFRSEEGLFHALAQELEKATEPMTCTALWDIASIKEYATSANRVSDYLGNLWRKGLVTRSPAVRVPGDSSRWAYSWKSGAKLNEAQEKPRNSIAELSSMIGQYGHEKSKSAASIYSRPHIDITDNGGVITIELPDLVLTIRPKSK